MNPLLSDGKSSFSQNAIDFDLVLVGSDIHATARYLLAGSVNVKKMENGFNPPTNRFDRHFDTTHRYQSCL